MGSNDMEVAASSGLPGPESLRVEVLARVTELLGNAPDVSAVIEKIAAEAAQMCGTRMAAIALFSDEGELERCASVGLSTHLAREFEKLLRTDWAPKYLTGNQKPFVIPTQQGRNHPSPIHKLVASEGLAQMVSIPLWYSDKLMGIIIAFNGNKRDYSREDVDFLLTFAYFVALTFANARLIEARNWERKAQDQFLDALSHELRTPLTSIMGFVQMIRKRFNESRDGDSRLRDQLDLLWAQSQRLNRLLDTFIDISNIERGEFALEHNLLDVTEVLAASVAQSRAQTRSRNEVKLELPDKGVCIHGDSRRLNHVFVHVISNALRYSRGDESIRVVCEERSTNKEVVITVVDRGPGIPGDIRREIFKRSYPSETRKAGGMGLGLYASKAIVEAHGGRLILDSTPGHGTTVKIALPIE